VSGARNNLRVPSRHDPDASLESVDLNDPGDFNDPADFSNLEAFLNEPDALYDVSPLPKDETPLQKEESAVENIPININIQDDEYDDNDTPTPQELTGAMSRAESLYYTPDITLENMSEINLN
jgi:hypothetical protein